MFTNQDIINIEIENKKYTAIAFNAQSCQLPSFLLQGEKKPGFLFKDGKLNPWYWKGFANYNNQKCLYFDQIDIYPLSQLASSLRNKAPKLIVNLAKALCLCDKKFLDLQSGVISASRIFFTSDDDVLILPTTLGDIFSATSNEVIRFSNTNSFVHANILPSFTLIDQMTQLLYYSITSIKPFEFDAVRTNNYTALDLLLLVKTYNINIDNDLVDKINKILHLKLNKTRDISSNYEPQKALKWFVERFESLEWNLETKEDSQIGIEDLSKIEIISPTIEKLQIKEKRIIFWRKRGALIIISTISAVLVLSFIGSRINEALKPPYTAGLTQMGVIDAYYEAQTNLDVQNLEASFMRGVKSPVANEITTLFVTRQTRMAYEKIDSIIKPQAWVEESMPPIEDRRIIYGINDVRIESIKNNQFIATSIFYSPYSLDKNEEVGEVIEQGIFKCYRFEQKQVFSFEYNDRGWFQISDIHTTEMKYVDTLLVPTYFSNDVSYDINTDERKTTSIVEDKYKNKSFL